MSDDDEAPEEVHYGSDEVQRLRDLHEQTTTKPKRRAKRKTFRLREGDEEELEQSELRGALADAGRVEAADGDGDESDARSTETSRKMYDSIALCIAPSCS